MNRRSFIATATLAPLVANTQANASVLDTEIIKDPFLYTLKTTIPDYHLKTQAGDIAFIVPGPLMYDGVHLLADGRFASVMLDWGNQSVNTVHVLGGETFTISVDRVQSYLSGRLIKVVGLRKGVWKGLRWNDI